MRHRLPIEIRVLKYARLKLRLNQQKMARVLGVNQSQVSRIESGMREVTHSMRQRYEELFGMTLEDLIQEFLDKLEKVASSRRWKTPKLVSKYKQIRNRKEADSEAEPNVVEVGRQTSRTKCTEVLLGIVLRVISRGGLPDHKLINYGFFK